MELHGQKNNQGAGGSSWLRLDHLAFLIYQT